MAQREGWLARVVSAGRSTPVAICALLLANAIPLVGVLLFGWNVAMVLIAYWLENGIIGLLNVPKIVLAGRSAAGGAGQDPIGVGVRAVFFAFHYGIFWVVHGVFVFTLTGVLSVGPSAMFGIASSADQTALLIVALTLLASHGISFVTNFLGKREYLRTSPERQSFQPYGRVVVLHMTVLLGGTLIIRLGQPVLLVVLLVVLKTVADLRFHLREHSPRESVATVV